MLEPKKNSSKRFQKLIELASQLPEPEDYFKGVGNVLPELPSNIIFLQRNTFHRISVQPQLETLLHRRYVLTLSLRQGGLACIGDKTFQIPEGYGNLVYPFHGHHYVVDQNRYFWLVATFDLFGQYLPNLMFNSFAVSPLAADIVERMLHLYLTPNAESRERGEGLLQSLMYALLFELHSGRTAETVLSDGKPAMVQQYKIELFEKINAHIMEKITDLSLSVEYLADRYGMSVTSLYALFQLLVGCKPGEYIRTMRIRRSVRLLNGNEMLIAEVAEQSGFSSPASFSRCFRNVIGCSPSEYVRNKFHSR